MNILSAYFMWLNGSAYRNYTFICVCTSFVLSVSLVDQQLSDALITNEQTKKHCKLEPTQIGDLYIWDRGSETRAHTHTNQYPKFFVEHDLSLHVGQNFIQSEFITT